MWSSQKQDYEELFFQGKYNSVIEILSSNPDMTTYEQVFLAYTNYKIGNEKFALDVVDSNFTKSDFSSDYLFVCALLLQAEILIDLSQMHKASKILEVVQQERHFFENDMSQFITARWLMLNGLYDLQSNNHTSAIDYLSQASDKVKQTGNDYFKGEVLHNLGLVYRKKGDQKNAESYYKSSLKLKQSYSNQSEIALTLNALGALSISKNDLNSAIDYFDKIIDLEDQLDNHQIVAKVLNNLGIVYEIKGNLTKALDYYKQSVKISEEINFIQNIFRCYLNMGNIHKQESNYDRALFYYRRASRLLDQYQDEAKKSIILTSIGLIHKSLGQFKQAEYYYLNSLEISKKLHDTKTMSSTLNNLGVLANLQGNINRAQEYFNQALEINIELSDEIGQGIVYSNLGLIAQKKFEYDHAKKYYEKSLQLRKNVGNEIELSSVLFHLVQLESNYDNLKSAQKHLKELQKLSKRSSNSLVRSRTKIAEAVVLQSSDDDVGHIRAHDLIEEVLSGEYVDFELNVFALISLCEYLIYELKTTNSIKVLSELEETVRYLYQLATENESHDLIAKVLIIQANLALVKLDTSEAVYLLRQANDIADSHNLEDVSLKISYLEAQVQANLYDLLGDSTENIGQRAEELEIESYIQNLNYQKQTTEILKEDIANIRRFNIELANLIQFDEGVPPSMQNLAKIVELSGREMQVAYSSLSLLKQLESQEYDVQFEDLKFSLIFEDLLNIYHTGFEKNDLTIDIQGNCDNLTIHVDPNLYEKVLDNIFLNLIKFSRKGSNIVIHINQNDDRLILTFDNDCEPVPSNELPMMFEKYHQYSPQKRIIKGYGLGLSYCKKALNEMNMHIQIDSPIPGKKSGFRTQLIV